MGKRSNTRVYGNVAQRLVRTTVNRDDGGSTPLVTAMGTYVVGQKEIMQKLEELLNSLEGEVYEQDFRDSCTEVADNYKHFTKD